MSAEITALRPKFAQIATSILEVCQAYLLPVRFNGVKMRITETMRSFERQKELEAAGSSKVKVGWHNYGLAFDFALSENGIYIADGFHPAYLACGQIGEAFGCIWGGRFKGFMDAGHIEYHPGFTLEALMDAEKLGKDLLA